MCSAIDSEEKIDINFRETINILKENSVAYWLCQGTLLGVIRDKKLIPWDHDIDWDYGWDAKPNYRSGFKQSNKLIWQCEYRKWRSWKYNRKTQYK